MKPVLPSSAVTIRAQDRAELELFDEIDKLLCEKFGKAGGPRFVAKLYDELITHLLAKALMHGAFSLPPGLGSYRVVRLRRSKPGARANLSLRYTEGKAVSQALGRTPMQERHRKRSEQLLSLIGAHSPEPNRSLPEDTHDV